MSSFASILLLFSSLNAMYKIDLKNLIQADLIVMIISFYKTLTAYITPFAVIPIIYGLLRKLLGVVDDLVCNHNFLPFFLYRMLSYKAKNAQGKNVAYNAKPKT